MLLFAEQEMGDSHVRISGSAVSGGSHRSDCLQVYGSNLDSGRQALFDRTKTADFCTSFIGNAGISVFMVCGAV